MLGKYYINEKVNTDNEEPEQLEEDKTTPKQQEEYPLERKTLQTIKNLRNGKFSGKDGIESELLDNRDQHLHKQICIPINQIWRQTNMQKS